MAVCRRGMLHTWDFGRRFGGGRAPIAARECLGAQGTDNWLRLLRFAAAC